MDFQAAFEQIELRVELLKRCGRKLEMSEAVAIKCVDNLPRNIGDFLSVWPAADEKLVSPVRELPLCLGWVALQVVSREQLDKSPVTNDSRGERGRVKRMAAEPQEQSLGQPVRHARQARGKRQNDEGDNESTNTDKIINTRKMKYSAEPFLEKLSQIEILIANFLQ